jgi:hypothetical protein
MSPDDVYDINVTFICNKHMKKPFKTKFRIDIRGCETLVVPFEVQSQIPEVVIEQPEFNFGRIQWGNRKELQMQMENKSKLEA